MGKTQKELAFLRDLYVDEQWTKRFTDLVDKHVKFSDEENFLYINASTGGHVIELREKINDDTAIFATCEDEHILAIARDKAAAIRSDVDFSMIRFEDNAFDAVLADATFVRPHNLRSFVENSVRVAKPGAKVTGFLVTAGSFGEIFSLLWEVLFNEDLGDHGAAAEQMISELPTVSQVEEIAREAGLENVVTHTANEVFEYENGAEFVNSALVGDFLLPVWLKTLNEKEKEQATNSLAQLVDAEDGSLTFRFSIKATLVSGEKESAG
jgi:ubiquinone/menaquinone biosynthesis C-methylase UbiE